MSVRPDRFWVKTENWDLGTEATASENCGYLRFEYGRGGPFRVQLDAQDVAPAWWLKAHPEPWDEKAAREYSETFDGVAERWLDEGYGSCILGEAASRRFVEEALRHFDGQRYVLYAYVVMPNHVHALFMPNKGEPISKILHSWKSYTAHRLHTDAMDAGTVWQKESWDHLVRSAAQFRKFLDYIKSNDSSIAYNAYEAEAQG